MSDRPITRVVTSDQVRLILDGKILGPNQPTLLNGVPVPVLREEETIRVPRAPAPAVPTPTPHAVVYVTRSTAVALALVAAAASALLTGGLVTLLH